MNRKFPVRQLRSVYHIGTLNSADKGIRGPSLEGHGLSVSLHPEAWQHIAKLGGLPWWQLTKTTKKNGHFLDIHRLSKTQRRQVAKWSVAHKYAREVAGWKISWFDDELSRACQMSFFDRRGALAEAEGHGAVVKPAALLAGTKYLTWRIGFTPDPILVPDYIALLFAERELRLDGAWWSDTLDPIGLSAPRGVIFPKRVRFWRTEQLTTEKCQTQAS